MIAGLETIEAAAAATRTTTITAAATAATSSITTTHPIIYLILQKNTNIKVRTSSFNSPPIKH